MSWRKEAAALAAGLLLGSAWQAARADARVFSAAVGGAHASRP